MSKHSAKTQSSRKSVAPIIDVDEDDDEQRRDASGRKRVAVIDCLLDSSTDESSNDEKFDIQKPGKILWLTFDEICHIRYVVVQTSLTSDKKYSQISNGQICIRCRKKINILDFLPSFLRINNHKICFICQHTICKDCSYSNFIPPSFKLPIPIRIQNLIKPSSTTIENKKTESNKSNTQAKTICYDCLQIFNEHLHASQYDDIKPAVYPFSRTKSLPPTPSKNFTENQSTRHYRHRRRPLHVTNLKIEKTTITSTSIITEF